MNRSLRLLLVVSGLLTASCDNIGHAFDPGFKGGRGTASKAKTPTTGAIVRSTRPRVLSALPKGGGVAETSPVVVLFSESMNPDTLTVTTGGGGSGGTTPSLPGLYVRKKDTGTGGNIGGATPTPVPIAGSYDFLAANRLVVFRAAQLEKTTAYEVVLGNTARDLDGQSVDREQVLVEFTTATDSTTVSPVVVSLFPPQNATDELRETPVYAVFNKAVTQTTVTPQSFGLRNHDTSAPLTAAVSFPLRSGTTNDTRVARLDPAQPLPGGITIDVVLTTDIKAGTQDLQTNGRDPFSTFGTLEFLALQAVAIGNPSVGFANRVNLANIDQLQLQVDLPSTAQAGDQVTVRVYGGDPTTTAQGDLSFVEAKAQVAVGGVGTQLVDLGNKLKNGAANTFEDGTLTLAARLERGAALSGFIVADTAETTQDTVRPALTNLGPPAGSDVATEFLTDLDSASLSGKASEALGAISLTVGSDTIGLFAAASDGRFVSKPFTLHRLTGPTPFTLLITDAAGNTGPSTLSGTITQRSATTGSVAGGSLVVEAFDDTTLLPVAGATVLVDPGLPTRPASPQRQIGTTDATGRVTFAGLTAPTHSITVVAASYHLVSRLDTAAGFVSLPLRPTANAVATVAGAALYTAALGPNASVGCNVLDTNDSDGRIAIPAPGSTSIPPTSIRPGRPIVLTGLGGPATPTDVPTLNSFTINIASITGSTNVNAVQPAPLAAVRAGETATASLTLLTSQGTLTNITPGYTVTVPAGAGLDLNDLDGNPEVVVHATFNGFSGTVPIGRGFTTGTPAAGLAVRGSYSAAPSLVLTSLAPILWSSLTLKDHAGNLARQRAFFIAFVGFVPGAFPGVPTVAAPGGSFTGAPDVTIDDRVAGNAGLLSLLRFTATAPGGRQWFVWIADNDAAGGTDVIPFPEVPAGGLTTGTWQIRAEAWQSLGVVGITADDFVLEDVSRLLVTYARSAPVDFTIQ